VPFNFVIHYTVQNCYAINSNEKLKSVIIRCRIVRMHEMRTVIHKALFHYIHGST